MSNKNLKTTLLMLAFVALAAAAVWAASGKVEGVVVDQEENPIRGATVTLTADDGSGEERAETNRRGKFSITVDEMAPGYMLRVEAAGFATYEYPIELAETRTLEVKIPLLTEEVAKKQREEIAAIETRNKASRRYNEGAAKYNENDFEAAIALFKEAIAEQDDLAIAWAGLGRVYLEQDRFAEAAEAFEGYEAINPGQEAILLMLYDCYHGLKDERADALLARLSADFKTGGTASRVFNLGVEAIKAQKLEVAREKFESALVLYPELYQAHINLAHIHRAQGNWQTALSEVELFLASDPKHARAQALRYQALKSLERTEDAAAALAGLRDSAPAEAAQIFHEQGVMMFNAGELDQALAAFLAAIDIVPEHARAHYRAGLCYASLKNNEQAQAYLEKFLELAPQDPEAATAREMLTYL